MIDMEYEIFGEVSSRLIERFPDVYVTDIYEPAPASFPCAMIIEMSNTTNEATSSSAGIENHVELMYEVNVYSNDITYKKSECKAIASFISDIFSRMGFSRIMHNPMPNMADATIYRMTSRYSALASKNHTIYRR